MPSHSFFRFFVFFLLGPSLAFAQSTPITGEVALHQKETGLPFLQNFKPKDYDGMPQNWAMLQDRRGGEDCSCTQLIE